MKRESNLTSNRMETLSKYFPAGRLLATLFVGMLFLLVSAQPATTSDTELQDTPQEVVFASDDDKDGPPPPPDGGREMNIRVFLQGYYINVGDKKLRRARGEGGSPYFSLSNVSDRVTIRLHNGTDYSVVRQEVEVYLLTSGYTINFQIDDEIEEPVWVSVKHRNHLETVYFETIDLTPGEIGTNLIELDFTTAADKAYGSNQAHLGDGVYGIYGGDVNQDGVLTGADLVVTNDDVRVGSVGYISNDANGDGVITGADLVLINDNVRLGVARAIPPSR